ncbi:unnamed protein product, partial [Musa textilis]
CSEDGSLTCGYSSFRGKRVSMEDYCDLKSTKIDGHTVNLFGIFDGLVFFPVISISKCLEYEMSLSQRQIGVAGHGGSHAAEYLKEHLFENLMRHPQFMSDTKLAISETYKKTDSDFLAAESNTSRDDGSTAVLIGKNLYVASVGDSHAVISKTGKAIPLSDDHKPNRSDERKRIEDAGGVVTWTGTWRAGGILAMARAFGNRVLNQFVVAEPVFLARQVVDEELASDGLWDVAANEVKILPLSSIQLLDDFCLAHPTLADNITCIVVRFHHDKLDVHGKNK